MIAVDSSNEVFASGELSFGDDGFLRIGKTKDVAHTTENTSLFDVIPPADFAPRAYGYNGSFSVINQALINSASAKLLSDAKEKKQADIIADFRKAVGALFAGYTLEERDSFAKQEAQARSFLDNIDENRTDLPLLKAAADARQVTMEAQANRIMAKATAAEGPFGTILGTRQAREDALEDASTVAEVEAI